jgi:hypothetical protein
MAEVVIGKPVFSRASTLRPPVVKASQEGSTREECRRIASQALAPYQVTLPDTDAFELYLIVGLSDVVAAGKKQVVVPYDPEFLFVMDCGFEALIGVSLDWSPAGKGDPNFPDFAHPALRSIPSRNQQDLIYPNVAGSIMIGIRSGTPDGIAKAGLEGAGLKNVSISGEFATASCRPFNERSICKDIEAKLPFVKYAEQNHIVRLIDFGPGWTVRRLT